MHKAKACILMCMDFRFQKSTQNWLEEKGYLGNCDEIIVAGASRDLVKPIKKFHKDALLRQITLSVKLHDIDEIIIIDHQDCGGYAKDNTIPSNLETNKDKSFHKKYALNTKKILKEKFPGKKLSFYYARLDGKIEKLI